MITIRYQIVEINRECEGDDITKKTLFESIGVENHYLYIGIDKLYGEFILETCGNPITLNDLEEGVTDGIAACGKLIETINNVIADPNTYWKPCDEEDEKYVSDYIETWGINN